MKRRKRNIKRNTFKETDDMVRRGKQNRFADWTEDNVTLTPPQPKRVRHERTRVVTKHFVLIDQKHLGDPVEVQEL
jgi:hypothetical protein